MSPKNKKMKLSKEGLKKLTEIIKPGENKKSMLADTVASHKESEKIKVLMSKEGLKKLTEIIKPGENKKSMLADTVASHTKEMLADTVASHKESEKVKVLNFQESSDLEKIASSAPLQKNLEKEQENFYSLKQEKKDEKYQTANTEKMQEKFKPSMHLGESRLKEEFKEQELKYTANSKKMYKPR